MEKNRDELNLTVDLACNYVREFIEESKGKYHAYRSWDDCYAEYSKYTGVPDKEQLRTLGFVLGFYLGNWGMMRNSAISEMNSKVYENIATIIFENDNLAGIREFANNPFDKQEEITNIISLKKEIFKRLDSVKTCLNCRHKITETLITKILSGTLSCTVAYDRYVKIAFRRLAIAQKLSLKSIKKVCTYCGDFYQDVIDGLEPEIKAELDNRRYPPMKVLDIIFWKYGKALDSKRQENKS